MTQRQNKPPSWADEQLARMLDAIVNLNDSMAQLHRGMKTRDAARLIGAESRQITCPPVRTNIFQNPDFNGKGAGTYGGVGGTSAVTYLSDTDGTTYARATWTVASTSGGGFFTYPTIDGSSGYPAFDDPLSASAFIRPSVPLTIECIIAYYNGKVSIGGSGAPAVACPANVWTLVPAMSVPLPAGPVNGVQVDWYVVSSQSVPINATIDIKNAIVGPDASLFFDGQVAPPGYASTWTGTPSASTSVAWALGTSQKLSVSTGRIAGWSLRELTGTVPAIARLRDGTDADGSVLAEIVIPAGGSVTESLRQQIGFTYGCYLDVVSGALEGAVHLGTEQ